MSVAKKLPSGSWRCRASWMDAAGKRQTKSFTANTKREAEAAAASYVLQMNEVNKPENVTVGEAIDTYIEGRSEILSPATIRGYQSLRENAYESIIDVKVSRLTQQMIQNCINLYAANHSPKSVANAEGLLMPALKNAGYKSGDVEILLPQRRRREVLIPTEEHLRLIISSVKDTDLYLPVLFAALLGLRRSEICALTWNNIDLENRVVKIESALVLDTTNSLVRKATKSYAGTRVLSLPDIIIKALPKRGDPIINITPNQISDRFRRLIKNMPIPSYTFHSLRHYNASIMLMLNVPDKYAMERMGHSTNHMLKNVYQHVFHTEQQNIANRINEFYNVSGLD